MHATLQNQNCCFVSSLIPRSAWKYLSSGHLYSNIFSEESFQAAVKALETFERVLCPNLCNMGLSIAFKALNENNHLEPVDHQCDGNKIAAKP